MELPFFLKRSERSRLENSSKIGRKRVMRSSLKVCGLTGKPFTGANSHFTGHENVRRSRFLSQMIGIYSWTVNNNIEQR